MSAPAESPSGLRGVARVVQSTLATEGGGFAVRRPFPTTALDHFDPFLLLDEMGPTQSPPGEAKGAPDHPHRGFETVTYLLSGQMQHRDSAGNAGTLSPGDVQWMTAGAGVIHSEMPTPAFQATGGLMHGFQLWVNLPARDKLMHPRYQDLPSEAIPVVTSTDGRVRVKVIAGESLGAKAVIDTRTPIVYLHVTLQPGGVLTQPVPAAYHTFAYVVRGAPHAGATGATRSLSEGELAVFDAQGDEIQLSLPADAGQPADILLIGGEPLNEPIARYGPFVMNTRAEIIQAVEDFKAGRFGQIPGS
ncbi:MAG TPA: pirin family protein [Polyangia bacterium]|nr:pirin family protein [Polyangia bacterium]